MKFKLIKLVLFLIAFNSFGQLSKIDSLRLDLKSASGNKRVDILMDITKRNYKNDVKEAKRFIAEAEKLSGTYPLGQVKILTNKFRISLLETNDLKTALPSLEEALNIAKKNSLTEAIKLTYTSLASTKRDYGDLEGAMKVLDEALKFSLKIKDIAFQAETYNGIGAVAYYKGDLPLAIENFTKSTQLYEKINNLSQMAGGYMNVGVVNFNTGKNEESLKWYAKALKVAKQINDSTRMASIMENIAISKSRMGNDSSALRDYESCIKMYKALKLIKNVGGCMDNLAQSYLNLGQTDKALKYVLEGIAIKEQVKDIRGLGISYRNIGTIYTGIKQMDKALECYLKAKEYAIQAQDEYLLEQVLYVLAIRYREKNQIEKAEKVLKESMEICKRINDMPGYSNALLELGNIFKSKKDFKQAISYYLESLKIKEKSEEQHNIAELLYSIGDSYYGLNNYHEAISYFDRALKMREESNNLIGLSQTYSKLANTYNALNDYKNAYRFQVLFHTTWDSVYNSKITQQITEMNAKFETVQKDKEILQRKAAEKEALLKAEKETQERKNTESKLLFSIIGITLMILLVGVVVYGNMQRRKTNEKLAMQNEEINLQKNELEKKNHIIEEKQREILDSINYAKRIQYTLLAHTDFLKEHIPNHFVYFNPKDIVSGDFYWATSIGSGTNRKFYLAVCDSTGHGVPGAFMSLLNISFLNEAVNEKGIEEPNKVFDFVRQRLIDNISKEGQKDGFDGILICIETLPSPGGEGPGVRSKITYAAANNAPILIKAALRQAQGPAAEPVEGPELIELNADRMPVGMGERKEDFKLYTVDAKPGDTLYLYTDGYADQFGGPKGKKFKYKALNELLAKSAHLPLDEQNNILKKTFEDWRGNLEQVDDVCVIGLKI